MWGLLKLLFYAVLVIVFIWFGRSVPLGKHTLFGHVERIWKTEAAQDLVQGAKESAGPTLDRIKRGVEAGVEAAENTPEKATAAADAGVDEKPAAPLRSTRRRE